MLASKQLPSLFRSCYQVSSKLVPFESPSSLYRSSNRFSSTKRTEPIERRHYESKGRARVIRSTRATELLPASPPRKVSAFDLRWRLPKYHLQFETTEDPSLPAECITIGQERALKALELGLQIKQGNFHVFISEVTGCRSSEIVEQMLRNLPKDSSFSPKDILLVHNWSNPNQPRVLQMPAGKGKSFLNFMNRMRMINFESSDNVVSEIDTMKKEFPYEGVDVYLKEVQSFIQEHLDGRQQLQLQPMQEMNEMRVNLLVDNEGLTDPPIVIEKDISTSNIFGSALKSPFSTPNFSHLVSGSLLKANGGYYIIDFSSSPAEHLDLATLKRTLQSNSFTFSAIPGIQPHPIPLNVKVIMIGDFATQDYLYSQDSDFSNLFSVHVEFTEDVNPSPAIFRQISSRLKWITQQLQLLPLQQNAVAEVIEHAMRIRSHLRKISLNWDQLELVLTEANFYAQKEKASLISASHIKNALEAKRFRGNSSVEESLDLVKRGVHFISTEGKVIGQVNALETSENVSVGTIGRPVRMTATTAVGKNGIVNIDREVRMTGNLYDKAVEIMAGYLRHRFASSFPLSLDASIASEQSYDHVDGDSASVAEVAVLLSSLSKSPIHQSIAVTGSINQFGEVQPVGGINEKIEGFFRVCKLRGLDGTHGVIIPSSNVEDLMLDQEVVEAAKEGKFHVYPIRTVDEAIEILTQMKAGARNGYGYQHDTINSEVHRELYRLALAHENFHKLEKKFKRKSNK